MAPCFLQGEIAGQAFSASGDEQRMWVLRMTLLMTNTAPLRITRAGELVQVTWWLPLSCISSQQDDLTKGQPRNASLCTQAASSLCSYLTDQKLVKMNSVSEMVLSKRSGAKMKMVLSSHGNGLLDSVATLSSKCL